MPNDLFFDNTIQILFESLLASRLVDEKRKSEFIDISKMYQSLTIDLRQINDVHNLKSKDNLTLQPIAPTSHIPLTELLKYKLDQSIKKICDEIEKIKQTSLETEVNSQLQNISRRTETLVQKTEMQIANIDRAYADALKRMKPIPVSNDAKEFSTHVANYANVHRRLTNVLKLQCSAYQGKIVKNALQPEDEVKKEMAKMFFEAIIEKGYDIENSNVTIDQKPFNLADVYTSKSDRDAKIAQAKTNATNLREKSFVNQASYYVDSTARQQAFKAFLNQEKQGNTSLAPISPMHQNGSKEPSSSNDTPSP